MNKILAALIVAAFATTGVFAAEPAASAASSAKHATKHKAKAPKMAASAASK
jgi:hypothetical protein